MDRIWTLVLRDKSNVDTRLEMIESQLRQDEGVTFGRSTENALSFLDIALSRTHCRFFLKGEDLYVEDIGSQNGTFINNTRLKPNTPGKITRSDQLRISTFRAGLEFPRPLPKARTHEPTKGAGDFEEREDRTVLSNADKLYESFHREEAVVDEETVMAALGRKGEQTPSEKKIQHILTFGSRKPFLSFILITCFTLLAGWGALKLQIDTSYDSMFSKEDPAYIPYQGVIRDFGSDNITLIYFKDKALFTGDKLALIEDLTFKLVDLDFVEKTESLFTALNIRDNQGALDIYPLMDSTPETEEEIAKARDNALYSPLISGDILSRDGNVTAITVTVKNIEGDPAYNRGVYDQINVLLEPYRNEFEQIFQVGPPRLNVEIEQGMFGDLQFISPLSAGILVIFITLFLRTGLAAILPLATAGASIFWTIGFMGFTGIPLNLLTAILPALVIVIGSTEDTHMLTSYLHGLQKTDKPTRIGAIRFMAVHVGLPIFITSFTTTVGFLSSSISDISLIRDFGYATSFSMFANLVSTILILPFILRFLGPLKARVKQESESTSKSSLAPVLNIIESIADRHQNKVVIVTALLVVIFGIAATTVKVSNDPLSYFKEGKQITRDAQSLHDDLAGMQLFYLTIEAQRGKDFRDPDQLKRVEQLVAAIRGQGSYDKVLSIVDYIALVNREMRQGSQSEFHVPDSRQLIEQYLLLFQRNDIERYLSADAKRANILIRHNISDSWRLNELLARLEVITQQTLGDEMPYFYSGKNLMINRSAETLFTSQLTSLALLVAIIFVIMTVLYGSPMAGVLSLVPNLVPIAVLFGTMGFFGIPLNPGTAIVAVIAIGIAIDDTIHLLSRYNAECRADPDQKMATLRAIRAESLPVISTSFSLAVGFGILVFSEFNIVAQFGALSALTMMVAMTTDLLITPVLMMRLRLVGIWDVISTKLGREDVLLKSELFQRMSRYQIRKIILLSEVKEFRPGETIIEEDDVGDNMYLILSGTLEVLRADQARDTIMLVAQLGCGHVIGEAGYMGADRRKATVKASKDGKVQLLVLNAEKVNQAMRFYPWILLKLERNITRILASRN